MSKRLTKTGYEKAVSEIRTLMANWFEAGVELFLKLREVDQSGIWKQPGHATFADFLRQEFPTALGLERYQNVINAIDMYGVDRVKQIGIESCHAMTVKAMQDSPEKRALLLSGIDNFVKMHGCSPDRNKVRELVISIAPETRRPPRELLATFAEAKLREELAKAKARVKQLEKENRELKKQISTKEKGSKSKKGGPKGASVH